MGILYLISYVLDILGEYLSARLKVMQQNILEKKQALFTAATIISSCRNSVCVLFNFIFWTIDRYVDDHSSSSVPGLKFHEKYVLETLKKDYGKLKSSNIQFRIKVR